MASGQGHRLGADAAALQYPMTSWRWAKRLQHLKTVADERGHASLADAVKHNTRLRTNIAALQRQNKVVDVELFQHVLSARLRRSTKPAHQRWCFCIAGASGRPEGAAAAVRA